MEIVVGRTVQSPDSTRCLETRNISWQRKRRKQVKQSEVRTGSISMISAEVIELLMLLRREENGEKEGQKILVNPTQTNLTSLHTTF
jgi:hypothetical protein